MGFCVLTTVQGQKIKEDVIGFFGGDQAERILSKHGIDPSSIVSIHADVPDLGWFTPQYSNLRSIRLEKGLFCIADNAFMNCASLAEVYIPDHVPEFGTAVFCGCTNLMRVHLPNDMAFMPSNTFNGCISLSKVFLADTIKTISRGAFKNCRRLANPWMPKSLEFIDEEAFFGCHSLGQVYIPATTKITDTAFRNCPGLVIRGEKDSPAEKYAKEHNIVFQPEQ